MRICHFLRGGGAGDLLGKPEEMAPGGCRCRWTSFSMKALPLLSDDPECRAPGAGRRPRRRFD